MKVVSENETMPYNVSLGRNGYDHTKGTSANSDREQYGNDDDRGSQWDPRPVDYNRRNIVETNHRNGDFPSTDFINKFSLS